jgi:hypothetical protein
MGISRKIGHFYGINMIDLKEANSKNMDLTNENWG